MKTQVQCQQEAPLAQAGTWMMQSLQLSINLSTQTSRDSSIRSPYPLPVKTFQTWTHSREPMECVSCTGNLETNGTKLAWRKSSWTTWTQHGSRVSMCNIISNNAKIIRSKSTTLTTSIISKISPVTISLDPCHLRYTKLSRPEIKPSSVRSQTIQEQLVRAAQWKLQEKRRLYLLPKRFWWNAKRHSQTWVECTSS